MTQEFRSLFEYSNHFNQKLIALICENRNMVSEKCLKLMNHIVNAHQIWNARITGGPTFEVWQMNDLDSLAAIDAGNYQRTLEILDSKNLDETLEYKNSRGEKFSNSIKDVLLHVVNHSTYHRAQIATELKMSGIEPINTDYIFYKRK